MTDSNRYRIEEFATTGWELIETSDANLSKEDCDTKLQEYIAFGRNPNKLRVVRESQIITTCQPYYAYICAIVYV